MIHKNRRIPFRFRQKRNDNNFFKTQNWKNTKNFRFSLKKNNSLAIKPTDEVCRFFQIKKLHQEAMIVLPRVKALPCLFTYKQHHFLDSTPSLRVPLNNRRNLVETAFFSEKIRIFFNAAARRKLLVTYWSKKRQLPPKFYCRLCHAKQWNNFKLQPTIHFTRNDGASFFERIDRRNLSVIPKANLWNKSKCQVELTRKNIKGDSLFEKRQTELLPLEESKGEAFRFKNSISNHVWVSSNCLIRDYTLQPLEHYGITREKRFPDLIVTRSLSFTKRQSLSMKEMKKASLLFYAWNNKRNLSSNLNILMALPENKVIDRTLTRNKAMRTIPKNNLKFFGRSFDKGRLKKFVRWFVNKWGLKKAIQLLECLKFLGFKYAKASGISLSLEDLYIPSNKESLVKIHQLQLLEQEFKVFQKTSEQTTYSAKFISTWTLINQLLRNAFLQYFMLRATNRNMLPKITPSIENKLLFANFNRIYSVNSQIASSSTTPPGNSNSLQHMSSNRQFGSDSLYIMAFSGARGNMSQVSQLTLMRGLMSDPLGKLVEFPIISNFREGLNLTEYLISCYGARKGIIDTGLRTATAGDFTRRLVDVAHSVIIQSFDCGTNNGIYLKELTLSKNKKTLFSFEQRLYGRVIANNSRIAKNYRNKEITNDLLKNLVDHQKPQTLSSASRQHMPAIPRIKTQWDENQASAKNMFIINKGVVEKDDGFFLNGSFLLWKNRKVSPFGLKQKNAFLSINTWPKYLNDNNKMFPQLKFSRYESSGLSEQQQTTGKVFSKLVKWELYPIVSKIKASFFERIDRLRLSRKRHAETKQPLFKFYPIPYYSIKQPDVDWNKRKNIYYQLKPNLQTSHRKNEKPSLEKSRLFRPHLQNRVLDNEICVRSPLTCETLPTEYLCRKCYGWNAIGRVIDIGEAVGILAAQSLGEPGTQLTLRTFHTGGIYSETGGDFKLVAPFDGNIIIPNYCTVKRYFNSKEKVSTLVAWKKSYSNTARDNNSVKAYTQSKPIMKSNEHNKKENQSLPGVAVQEKQWSFFLRKNIELSPVGKNEPQRELWGETKMNNCQQNIKKPSLVLHCHPYAYSYENYINRWRESHVIALYGIERQYQRWGDIESIGWKPTSSKNLSIDPNQALSWNNGTESLPPTGETSRFFQKKLLIDMVYRPSFQITPLLSLVSKRPRLKTSNLSFAKKKNLRLPFFDRRSLTKFHLKNLLESYSIENYYKSFKNATLYTTSLFSSTNPKNSNIAGYSTASMVKSNNFLFRLPFDFSKDVLNHYKKKILPWPHYKFLYTINRLNLASYLNNNSNFKAYKPMPLLDVWENKSRFSPFALFGEKRKSRPSRHAPRGFASRFFPPSRSRRKKLLKLKRRWGRTQETQKIFATMTQTQNVMLSILTGHRFSFLMKTSVKSFFPSKVGYFQTKRLRLSILPKEEAKRLRLSILPKEEAPFDILGGAEKKNLGLTNNEASSILLIDKLRRSVKPKLWDENQIMPLKNSMVSRLSFNNNDKQIMALRFLIVLANSSSNSTVTSRQSELIDSVQPPPSIFIQLKRWIKSSVWKGNYNHQSLRLRLPFQLIAKRNSFIHAKHGINFNLLSLYHAKHGINVTRNDKASFFERIGIFYAAARRKLLASSISLIDRQSLSVEPKAEILKKARFSFKSWQKSPMAISRISKFPLNDKTTRMSSKHIRWNLRSIANINTIKQKFHLSFNYWKNKNFLKPLIISETPIQTERLRLSILPKEEAMPDFCVYPIALPIDKRKSVAWGKAKSSSSCQIKQWGVSQNSLFSKSKKQIFNFNTTIMRSKNVFLKLKPATLISTKNRIRIHPSKTFIFSRKAKPFDSSKGRSFAYYSTCSKVTPIKDRLYLLSKTFKSHRSEDLLLKSKRWSLLINHRFQSIKRGTNQYVMPYKTKSKEPISLFVSSFNLISDYHELSPFAGSACRSPIKWKPNKLNHNLNNYLRKSSIQCHSQISTYLQISTLSLFIKYIKPFSKFHFLASTNVAQNNGIKTLSDPTYDNKAKFNYENSFFLRKNRQTKSVGLTADELSHKTWQIPLVNSNLTNTRINPPLKNSPSNKQFNISQNLPDILEKRPRFLHYAKGWNETQAKQWDDTQSIIYNNLTNQNLLESYGFSLESIFLFSQYFSSNFYGFRSQLYVSNLRIFNYKTTPLNFKGHNLENSSKINWLPLKDEAWKKSYKFVWNESFASRQTKNRLSVDNIKMKKTMAENQTISETLEKIALQTSSVNFNQTKLFNDVNSTHLTQKNAKDLVSLEPAWKLQNNQNITTLKNIKNNVEAFSLGKIERQSLSVEPKHTNNLILQMRKAFKPLFQVLPIQVELLKDEIKQSVNSNGKNKIKENSGQNSHDFMGWNPIASRDISRHAELENFACGNNSHYQNYQTTLTLIAEGQFKKNRIIVEIRKKHNLYIYKKKDNFLFTIPISLQKGLFSKTIPYILPPSFVGPCLPFNVTQSNGEGDKIIKRQNLSVEGVSFSPNNKNYRSSSSSIISHRFLNRKAKPFDSSKRISYAGKFTPSISSPVSFFRRKKPHANRWYKSQQLSFYNDVISWDLRSRDEKKWKQLFSPKKSEFFMLRLRENRWWSINEIQYNVNKNISKKIYFKRFETFIKNQTFFEILDFISIAKSMPIIEPQFIGSYQQPSSVNSFEERNSIAGCRFISSEVIKLLPLEESRGEASRWKPLFIRSFIGIVLNKKSNFFHNKYYSKPTLVTSYRLKTMKKQLVSGFPLSDSMKYNKRQDIKFRLKEKIRHHSFYNSTNLWTRWPMCLLVCLGLPHRLGILSLLRLEKSYKRTHIWRESKAFTQTTVFRFFPSKPKKKTQPFKLHLEWNKRQFRKDLKQWPISVTQKQWKKYTLSNQLISSNLIAYKPIVAANIIWPKNAMVSYTNVLWYSFISAGSVFGSRRNLPFYFMQSNEVKSKLNHVYRSMPNRPLAVGFFQAKQCGNFQTIKLLPNEESIGKASEWKTISNHQFILYKPLKWNFQTRPFLKDIKKPRLFKPSLKTLCNEKNYKENFTISFSLPFIRDWQSTRDNVLNTDRKASPFDFSKGKSSVFHLGEEATLFSFPFVYRLPPLGFWHYFACQKIEMKGISQVKGKVSTSLFKDKSTNYKFMCWNRTEAIKWNLKKTRMLHPIASLHLKWNNKCIIKQQLLSIYDDNLYSNTQLLNRQGKESNFCFFHWFSPRSKASRFVRRKKPYRFASTDKLCLSIIPGSVWTSHRQTKSVDSFSERSSIALLKLKGHGINAIQSYGIESPTEEVSSLEFHPIVFRRRFVKKNIGVKSKKTFDYAWNAKYSFYWEKALVFSFKTVPVNHMGCNLRQSKRWSFFWKQNQNFSPSRSIKIVGFFLLLRLGVKNREAKPIGKSQLFLKQSGKIQHYNYSIKNCNVLHFNRLFSIKTLGSDSHFRSSSAMKYNYKTTVINYAIQKKDSVSYITPLIENFVSDHSMVYTNRGSIFGQFFKAADSINLLCRKNSQQWNSIQTTPVVPYTSTRFQSKRWGESQHLIKNNEMIIPKTGFAFHLFSSTKVNPMASKNVHFAMALDRNYSLLLRYLFEIKRSIPLEIEKDELRSNINKKSENEIIPSSHLIPLRCLISEFYLEPLWLKNIIKSCISKNSSQTRPQQAEAFNLYSYETWNKGYAGQWSFFRRKNRQTKSVGLLPSLCMESNRRENLNLSFKQWYDEIYCYNYSWHFMNLIFDIVVAKNVNHFRNARYNFNENVGTIDYQNKKNYSLTNVPRSKPLVQPTINFHYINVDAFQINTFNNIYFFYEVASLANSSKSSDITQGVPLLKRYFDLPKESPIHLLLKQTFEKYYSYGTNETSLINNFSSSRPTPKKRLMPSNYLYNYNDKFLPDSEENQKQQAKLFCQSMIWKNHRHQHSTVINPSSLFPIKWKDNNSFFLWKNRKTSPFGLKQQTEFSHSEACFKVRTVALKYSLIRVLQKIVNNVQAVYRGQGVDIYDQHIEVLVSQMGFNVINVKWPLLKK